ncbi:hypothetical protein A2856_01070 [Candidatus Uhrbacteria bacterium RIFCSPHIGHO2_01_FULL_63_20]|uniref:Uncharacterized protein n=1 Tax=Candidatus Uhrbacteria bacterium RIFCSPHIGHO2_01_FULL_63_20 TaxID=1802385 RepID=A0A1F7TNG2_9BACT|nr:MAG: hypothetical protein A2856_01070 [Candidatus Uhrbacteria bacterium RIFCSPHIGHO2_01_FULL_63_20]
MKRSTKIPTPRTVTLLFSALTPGQQAYVAKKLGKTAQQVSGNTPIQIPGSSLSRQQALQLQGIQVAPAQSGKIRLRQRTRKGSGTQAVSQAGSGTVKPEMKISDYSLNGLPLKLVYGNGQQVASHLGTLENKTAIAAVAIDAVKTYADGKYPWAAALYVDGFEGNFENTKQTLPRQFVKGIIDTLNGKSVMGKVALLNFISKFSNGLSYVNTSASLKGTPCVRRFLGSLQKAIFGTGWNVIGTHDAEQTNTVFFLGDQGARHGFQWTGENFTFVPSAFPQKVTDFTVGPDFIIETDGTRHKGLIASQMWNAAHEGFAPEAVDVLCDKIDGKVSHLSVVTQTKGYGYVAVAAIEGGKNGYVPLAIDLSGNQIALKPLMTLAVPADVTKNLGWVGRISERGATMVASNSDAAITRLPVAYMPPQMRSMVDGLYQPQAAA